jgi:mannose-6-phosphate isomerase-like protein (cupin superfamily)
VQESAVSGTADHQWDEVFDVVVVGGQLTVEYGVDGEQTRQLGPGEFWTGDAKVPFTITSGPEGAQP